MTDEKGNVFLKFIRIKEEQLDLASLDAPLTHSLIAVKCQNAFLFMYNKWRSSWELPGGVIEKGETARQCVIRELFSQNGRAVNFLNNISHLDALQKGVI